MKKENPMRRLAAVLLASFVALPLVAAVGDGYRFHVKVTDGRTGLLANPEFAKLHMTDAQLEKAEDDRVILFDRVEGAKWNWLMVSWLYDGPPPEYAINEHGTAKSPAAADFTLTPIDYKKVRLRCAREQCRVSTTSLDGREVVTDLRRAETTDVRFDSDIAVTFAIEH
jgi:hypothetical protein